MHLYEVIESERYIGIVLEYGAGGELFDYILAHKCLKERDACRLFAQLVSGVSYLHRKKIIHRDLKLENLLLDRNRNVIITDFGFANNFSARENDLMATSCGSPCYAAPELVVQDGLYVGAAVDVWSCGVILYAMLAGYLPFDDDPANPDGDNINLLYKYIMATPLTFPDYIGPEPRSLLLRMLVPDPMQRATLDEVMAHPWLAPYRDLFQFSVQELERAAIEQQAQKRQVYREQMLYQQKLLEQQFAEKALPRSNTDVLPTPVRDEPVPASASLPTVADDHPAPAISMAQPVPMAQPAPTVAYDAKEDAKEDAAVAAAPAAAAATAATAAAAAASAAMPPPDAPPKRKTAESSEQPSKMHATADSEQRADSKPSPRPSSASGVKARVLSSGVGTTELNLAALTGAKRSGSARRTPEGEPMSSSNSASSKKNVRAPTIVPNARAEAVDKSEGRVYESKHSSPVTPAPPVVAAPAVPAAAASASAAPAADATADAAPAPAPAPASAPVSAPDWFSSAAPPAPSSAPIATPAPRLDTTERGLAPPLVFNAGMPTMLASLPPAADRTSRENVLSSFGQPPVSLTTYLPQRLNEPARPRKSSTSKTEAEAEASAAPVAAAPVSAQPEAPTIPRKQPPSREDAADASPSKKRASLQAPPVARPKTERPRPLSMQAMPGESLSVPTATVPSAPGRVSLDTTIERPPSQQSTFGRTGRKDERPKRSVPWWRRLSGTHQPQPLAVVREGRDEARRRPEPVHKPAPALRPDGAAAVTFASGSDRRFSSQADTRPEPDYRRISLAGDARTAPRPMRTDNDDRRLTLHVGAVDQAALTTRNPDDVMRDVFDALFSMGVEMRRARNSEFRIECMRVKRPGVLRQFLTGAREDDPYRNRWSRLGRNRPLSSSGQPRTSLSHDEMERGLSRMSIGGLPSSNTGLSRFSMDEPAYAAPTTAPLYGDSSQDGGHEVRFSVEVTRIPTLHGLYSVDIRRIKGNVWSYKFLYNALLERIELGGSVPQRR